MVSILSRFGGQVMFPTNNIFAQEVVGGYYHIDWYVDGAQAQLAWPGTAGRSNRLEDRVIRPHNNQKEEQKRKRTSHFVLFYY